MADDAILLATIDIDGGLSRLRVATSDYYSDGLHWQARITKTPGFEVAVSCSVWDGRGSYSIGEIELADPDETIAIWDEDARDARIELRIVSRGQAYADGVVVARALVDKPRRSKDSWVITLRGVDAWLDRPACRTVYEETSTDLDPNELTRNAVKLSPELVGDSVSVVLGRVNLCEPDLVSPPQLIHQITDAALWDITTVYSGGSVATPATDYDPAFADAGIVWNITPSARVLIDADGIADFGDAIVVSRFDRDSWTTDGPPGWSVGSTDEPEEVAGVGLRWAAGGIISVGVPTEYQGGYGAVLVYVLRLGVGASLEVQSDTVATIEREGRHAIVCGLGATVTLAATGDVLIAFAAVYPIDSALPSLTVAKTVRHLLIARAGLLPAEQAETEVIDAADGGFATEGSFALWVASGSEVEVLVDDDGETLVDDSGNPLF